MADDMEGVLGRGRRAGPLRAQHRQLCDEREADRHETDEPDAYLVSETATRLRISRNTCYELIRQGQIPSVHIGRRILVPREALENLLNVTKEN